MPLKRFSNLSQCESKTFDLMNKNVFLSISGKLEK
jgi:hypothetical protein